jgi:hypothetical protein
MEKFLANPLVKFNTPKYILPPKLAIAQWEVLARMTRSLEEIKQVYFSAKLASKHAILEATINAWLISFMRDIAKVLSVHPWNIAIAMQRCMVNSDSSDALWSWLSIKKKG